MKKFNSIAFIVFVSLILLLSSCVFVNFPGFNTVEGRGEPLNYEISVGHFSGINVEGNAEIHYYYAPVFNNTVDLLVYPNLLEYYELEVINDILHIRNTRRISSSRVQAKVFIHSPVLNSINLSGVGNFITHDVIRGEQFSLVLSGAGTVYSEFDLEHLELRMSGAGNIELKGSVENASFVISGAGDFNALSLETKNTTIRLSGAASASVTSTESLKIDASGVGSIIYGGSPTLDFNSSGMVTLRRAN